MTTHLTRVRFTADQFEQMVEAGVFYENNRVELIDGEVVEMASTGHRHMQCVNRATKLFVRLFGEATDVSVQSSLRVGPRYVPQPDLVLLRLHPNLYKEHIPGVQDALLVMEVGDTTVQLDLRTKLPRYADGGVQELWLVDLQQDTLTICREPVAGGYQAMTVLRRGDTVALLAFPDRAIAVTGILGEAES